VVLVHLGQFLSSAVTQNRRLSRAADVKADILRRIKEEGIPVSQAAKDHGMHESTIYGWLGAGAKGTPSWAEFEIRFVEDSEDLGGKMAVN